MSFCLCVAQNPLKLFLCGKITCRLPAGPPPTCLFILNHCSPPKEPWKVYLCTALALDLSNKHQILLLPGRQVLPICETECVSLTASSSCCRLKILAKKLESCPSLVKSPKIRIASFSYDTFLWYSILFELYNIYQTRFSTYPAFQACPTSTSPKSRPRTHWCLGPG